MTPALRECEPRAAASAFACHDPLDARLGSGGGTAYALHEAWRAGGSGEGFEDWIRGAFKTVVHGGGQSRRLPSYAAVGKLFIPLPVFRWTRGQRLDQRLLDLQLDFLGRVRESASAASRCLVASGDVLLRSAPELPPLPDADVVLLGLWARPEDARRFGVLFCDRERPEQLEFFLQKPSTDRIRELAADKVFLLDVGVWLLSARAVTCLLRKCGWDSRSGSFPTAGPREYDLYGSWALHLGRAPVQPDPEVSALSVAVVPLPEGEFYHFGTNREMIHSAYQLQTHVVDQTRLGAMGAQPHPRQFVQNALFSCPLRQEENHTLWVENSRIPSTWSLASEHVLTGVPPNEWTLRLDPGVCLDAVPVGETAWVLRAYGMDDPFRGDCSAPETLWFDRPLSEWFQARGLEEEGKRCAGMDIQSAALHPEIGVGPEEAGFIQWLIAARPEPNEAHTRRWVRAPRWSADRLAASANLSRLYAQRRQYAAATLPAMARNPNSIFYKVDLQAAADFFATADCELPPPPAAESQPLVGMHDRMFRAEVARRRGDSTRAAAAEREAFAILRDCVVQRVERQPVRPRSTVLSDQIVWGRCPVRLDLAGGWTDTPPYCLEFGGRVVNVAVDLNGQPPIQVFARLSNEPRLTIRSIDLGLEERIETYDDVLRLEGLGSGFAVARAAFALAGFHPRFGEGRFDTLRRQLEEFGGGLELSMLSAVPKGSGLGVSSLLATTLLGTLSDVCGLAWNRLDLMARVSALEQLLTSGGGWQDQLGGMLEGVKWIETAPGLDQTPTFRWLPGRFFQGTDSKDAMALYYTGITRVARNVLGEIVRGLFLNDHDRLNVLDGIGRNAVFAREALQQQDFKALVRAVRASWTLNQKLDSGTNPPEVQAIVERCGSELAACKLLGAGGGGYLLLIAQDPDAARVLRRRLASAPPNQRARFVDFALSEQGLHVTRS
jgi:galactokinase/mevalonate kinase-like predicted kinase